MQRVSSFLPSWEKRSSISKGGGFFGWSNRASAPNALSKINVGVTTGRIQRETLWPATLDVECDKAARILKSFCVDGYLPAIDDETLLSPISSNPHTPIKLTRRIPKRVLQNAAGIAIFTCMRSGLWMTGSGGSGILIARKSDGTWSPPSGIMLHTPTLSFIIGVDVYDCVLVVSNLDALESMTRPRVTLGEDVGLTSGPSTTLDSDEKDVQWNDVGNTVLSYVKSRGQLQLVNLNGCILTERGNENTRFYSGDVTQMDVLSGNVGRHVEETAPLFEVIKMAEGRTDFDSNTIDKLALTPAPGDATIATPNSTPPTPRTAFGFLSSQDPDPFGVLALEMAGLEIREAGSRLRPSSSQFDLGGGPLSPAQSKFSRQSVDTYATRSNRGSYMSARTGKSLATEFGTQTDIGNTPGTTPSPGQSEAGHERSSFDRIPEDAEEVDYTKVDLTPLQHLSRSSLALDTQDMVATPSRASVIVTDVSKNEQTVLIAPAPEPKEAGLNESSDESDDKYDEVEDEGEYDSDDDEEPVVFEVASVQRASTQAVASRVVQVKGSVVNIPKRIPPPLPLRSPARMSQASKAELGPEFVGYRSPLYQSFTEADMSREDSHDRNDNAHEAHDSASDANSSEDVSGGSKGDSASLSARSAHSFNTDNSDSMSGTKHTSVLSTDVIGDRWSCDGSTLTTPTSYSIPDDVAGEETPKKDSQVSTKLSLGGEEDSFQEEAVLKTATTVNNAVVA